MLQMLNQAMKPQQAQPQANNPMAMIQQFAQFKKQMAGKNPEAMVNELIKSGKMSQQQFEDLKQQAQALQSILK